MMRDRATGDSGRIAGLCAPQHLHPEIRATVGWPGDHGYRLAEAILWPAARHEAERRIQQSCQVV